MNKRWYYDKYHQQQPTNNQWVVPAALIGGGLAGIGGAYGITKYMENSAKNEAIRDNFLQKMTGGIDPSIPLNAENW